MTFELPQLPESIAPYQEKILATVKPCITMSLKPQAQLALWQSKVGGQPYLPLQQDYPHSVDGQPLTLLAQINFSELPADASAALDFPTQGILQFYIAAGDVYGMNFDDPQSQDSFRVLYFEDVITDQTQLQQNFPDVQAMMGEDAYLPFSGQYAIEFTQDEQAISTGDFAFGRKILDVEQLYDFEEEYEGDDFYDEFVEPYEDLFPEAGHHLGGYPYFTQTDPREYNEKIQDYILLFQLDTDEEYGNDIMWGDAGVGNFFIHPDDLKKRDFSRVVYNWDCS